MQTKYYDREKAIAYAHTWAFGRNPRYFDFSALGGDCTNFTSQALYAGAGVMNPKPILGWYYYSANNRAPAWTGVQYLYNFLTTNKGAGPYGAELPLQQAMPGDVIQLSRDGVRFSHSLLIVRIGEPVSPENILIATHTLDSDNRPLSSYVYHSRRLIHIIDARK